MKKGGLVSLLLLATNTVMARDEQSYIGLDYTLGEFTQDGVPDALRLDGVRIRGGQYFVPHIALEAHFLYGTSGDSIEDGSGNKLATLDNKHPTSLFFRGDVGDTFKLYLLAGYSETSYETTGILAGNVKSTDRDISYGGGLALEFSKNTYLDLSYVVYHDEESYEYATGSLGVTHQF